jgi:signal transduction histidine kinase
MGSRGRSIRLRIYVLVAIPLVTMIGLLAYVVTTSINNVINLDRAPSLINATSVPTAEFVKYLQSERLAAVIYLFKPTPANLEAYQAAAAQTDAHERAFVDQMNSSAVKSSADSTTLAGIQGMLGQLKQLPKLRQGVEARLVAPGRPMTALDGLGAYSQAILTEPRLFLDEADSMTNATAASQALGLIASVSAREALSQEQALLAGMLIANKASAADRGAFAEIASTRQGDVVDAESIFNAENQKIFNAALSGTSGLQQQLTQIEGAVATGVPISALPLTQQQWQDGLTGTLLADYYNGGIKDAQAQLADDRQIASSARDRMFITLGIALLGLLLTIAVTTVVGRTIVRRLRGLESTALTLAENQLPDVVARLRRGDDVDIAAEAPPLRVGGDEIGRVGQAFDLVRQTAIRSAVEEAKLRRGLNDVFRSLARRSQSLLHRQLTLLDQMERRASDPEALDDLFRLDHLTTRMRRHAEGLVILAGAPPGRGWSSPVRMMDVMRGAIAEVEDYARVSVASRSQAALSGSAVADVIHLLAELIENATTLSPPYTSVRVSGDTVANGFAIEVEDRGLGMSEHRIAELNDRLASPPEFNPSDSEQLGLFVVSQLAKRHGIKVTLKASPYGGTEAVVLIPRHLVVAEEAFRASLPGEPAALSGGLAGANGKHFPPAELGFNGDPLADDPLAGLPDPFADASATGPLGSIPTQFEQGPTISGGPRISGAMRRTQSFRTPETPGFGAQEIPESGAPEPSAPDSVPRGGHHAPRRGANGNTGISGGPDMVLPADAALPADVAMTSDAEFPPDASDRGDLPRRARGRSASRSGPAPFDVFGSPGAAASSSPPGSPFGTASSSPGSYTTEPPPFPAWQGAGDASAADAPTDPAPARNGSAATGGTDAPRISKPPWELSPDSGPLPVIPGTVEPATADGTEPNGDGLSDGGYKGLPRRVKQASIAPQLRGEPPARLRPTAASAPAPAQDLGSAGQHGGRSPAEIRATMSSLQRGWQAGRSESAAAGEPPWESEQATEGDTDGA